MGKTDYFLNILTLSSLSVLLLLEIMLMRGYAVELKYPVEKKVEFPLLTAITIASIAYVGYKVWSELYGKSA